MSNGTRRAFLFRGISAWAACGACTRIAQAQPDPEKSAVDLITPAAARAIDRGLALLASRQDEEGAFGSGGYSRNVAVCGLAGMAFMAAGSTPGRGPYGQNVDRSVDFILANTQESGFINVSSASSHGPMYGHGFATLFLAESYGMTMRSDIREKLTKAVNLIVNTQNSEGGWRYQPQRRDADISVTICQIMALRAARNAGLYVPRETIDRCTEYVKRSQNADGGFMYMLQGGGQSAFPRSAAGVVALYSAGIYDSPEIKKGLEYLMQFLPRGNDFKGEPLLLWPLLRRAGHVACRRRALGSLVSGHSRCAGGPPGRGWHLAGFHLRRVRHRNGVRHFANAQQLSPHLSALRGLLILMNKKKGIGG